MRRFWSVLGVGLVGLTVAMASANAASPTLQRMNLGQIAKGNYSSVQGTWQSTGGVRISVSGSHMKIHDGAAGNVTLRGLHVVQTDFANSANFGGYTATTELTRGRLVFYPGTLPHLDFRDLRRPLGLMVTGWA
jgi:hypothetical protein